MEDSALYKNKYKELKRKFKSLQSEHLKYSNQLEIASKILSSLVREKNFLNEKLQVLSKKSGGKDLPTKRQKVSEDGTAIKKEAN